jgi:hypothetical protein
MPGLLSQNQVVTGSYPHSRIVFDKRKKPWHTLTVSRNQRPGVPASALPTKESPMSIDAHLASLEKKHGELEAELRGARPTFFPYETIVDIKRRKLRLKDEIKRLRPTPNTDQICMTRS